MLILWRHTVDPDGSSRFVAWIEGDKARSVHTRSLAAAVGAIVLRGECEGVTVTMERDE